MPRPRIFYYCYDGNLARGGEKHSYQHVDILNRAGFDAFALHTEAGFRQTWFDNDTRIAYAHEIDLDPEVDYLVLPESLGLVIPTLPGRKVIFNKNVFLGFNVMLDSPRGPDSYLSSDIVAVLCVSEHNRACLQFAYPNLDVQLVRLSIKPQRFPYRPLADKQLEIAYATKAPVEQAMLRQLLFGRQASGRAGTAGLTWTAIQGLSEAQVSEVLQRSLIFVFMSAFEGLGRLPLEAMACGCLVCAHDRGPMSEYLPRAYRFASGDVVSIATRIEEIVAAYPDGLAAFEPLTAEGRDIALTYDDEAQERSVVAAWEKILTRLPNTARPSR